MADPARSVQRSAADRAALRARVRGLYGIADAGAGRDPEALAAALLEGGCRVVQLRCKGWAAADIEPVARRMAALCRGAGALFILNDHPALAAKVDADGVHVGQTDMAPGEARMLVGEGRLVGVSHNAAEHLSQAAPDADYLAVGPMFPTTNLSRPKPVQGPELLAAARAAAGNRPVVAIGGIQPHLVPLLDGADAFAVIGAIGDAADPTAMTRAFVEASRGA